MNEHNHLSLTASVRKVKGVGDKTEKSLARLNIYTVADLLHHFPRDYDVFEAPALIETTKDSMKDDKIIAVKASITNTYPIKQIRNLKILNCQVADKSGYLRITWFNMPYLRNRLKKGFTYIFRGKVSINNGLMTMEHPQIYSEKQYKDMMNVMQPIYSLTSGLSNNQITKLVKNIFDYLELLKDPLPSRIRDDNKLINYGNALKQVHFPQTIKELSKARERLIFDEFFLFSFALEETKKEKVLWYNNFNIEEKEECKLFIENLPYKLTNAQLKTWKEIKADLTGIGTMNRLIQGDVGSGKTIVAALTLFLAVLNGYQGSIMVPTEVLAKQHYVSLKDMFTAYNINVELLVGSMNTKAKSDAYERIKNGQADIIVGTHAIIQGKVEFSDLAVVITDEQHRFGVRQRENLTTKGNHPHVLVMSATPIPRTLAIILYSDLKISIIDEMPANRLPIKNCVIDKKQGKSAYNFIQTQVFEGRQVYIICPMVEESEVMDGENVIDYTDKLKSVLSKDINVQYLHGKLKANEKNEIMESFAKGEIQVLVSTTVIEVGINVPNATVMMIENSERFGLAQLHQLRGRVGRGKHQSFCIFVSGSRSKQVKKRLEILLHSNDGFHIAEEDLKLRGPGDMLGIRQSGIIEFKIGDIYEDSNLLIKANNALKSLDKIEIEYIRKEILPLYNLEQSIYNNTL